MQVKNVEEGGFLAAKIFELSAINLFWFTVAVVGPLGHNEGATAYFFVYFTIGIM